MYKCAAEFGEFDYEATFIIFERKQLLNTSKASAHTCTCATQISEATAKSGDDVCL